MAELTDKQIEEIIRNHGEATPELALELERELAQIIAGTHREVEDIADTKEMLLDEDETQEIISRMNVEDDIAETMLVEEVPTE